MTKLFAPTSLIFTLLAGCAAETGTLGEDSPTGDLTDGEDESNEEEPDEDDIEDDTEDEDEDEDEEPIEIPSGDDPIEGSWTTVEELMTLDQCNMQDWVIDGPGDQLILDVVGDGELEIFDSRGMLSCSYDELGFDCDTRTLEDRTASTDYGLSAIIVLQTAASGVFDGTEHLAMETDIVADCSGSDCWLVELATASFPCEMQVWTSAEAD
jgi:hypothetical protein